jgi:hypothetical protein
MVTHTMVNRQPGDIPMSIFSRFGQPMIRRLFLQQVKQENQQMEHCSLVSGISSAAIRAVPRWSYILVRTTAQFRTKFSSSSKQSEQNRLEETEGEGEEYSYLRSSSRTDYSWSSPIFRLYTKRFRQSAAKKS